VAGAVVCPERRNARGELIVSPRCRWADTGVDTTPGVALSFSARGWWVDLAIPCGPDGFAFNPAGVLSERRVRHFNWCALLGALDQDETTAFLIGAGPRQATFDRAGRLYVFANDNGRGYFNNWGRVRLDIRAAQEPREHP
jgi:hypothetical protein